MDGPEAEYPSSAEKGILSFSASHGCHRHTLVCICVCDVGC